MTKRTDNLNRARAVKNDEFYTQLCDIEKECDNYHEYFKDKIIYCNCDTADSNFVKYFSKLKQRGIIKDVLYSGGLAGLDFRSIESIEKLKQADIVITNPPFSLFREYFNQIISHGKRFLIICNHNAVKYKYVFPLIKDNKLWVGTRNFGVMLFDVPNPVELIKNGTQGKTYKIVDGIPKAIISATWLTNLEYREREFLPLVRSYYGNESAYQKYDNYDAININDKRHIPKDYYGVMGVPSTFLDRYNPEQFSILGLDREMTSDKKGAAISGRRLYTRIFIKRNIIANDNMCLTEHAA